MKNIIVSAGVALVLSLLVGVSFVMTRPTVTPPLGSIAGPNIPSPYLSWGGVSEYNFAQTMTTGASTTCSFVTPAATTSLRFAIARFTYASSTANVDAQWGKGGVDATTTALSGDNTMTQNVPGTLVASSTAAVNGGIDPVTILAPSTHINLKIGSVGAGASPSGTCVASVIAIP